MRIGLVLTALGALSVSLAACGAEPVVILDPGCVAKTFPDYFQVLAGLTVPRPVA